MPPGRPQATRRGRGSRSVQATQVPRPAVDATRAGSRPPTAPDLAVRGRGHRIRSRAQPVGRLVPPRSGNRSGSRSDNAALARAPRRTRGQANDPVDGGLADRRPAPDDAVYHRGDPSVRLMHRVEQACDLAGGGFSGGGISGGGLSLMPLRSVCWFPVGGDVVMGGPSVPGSATHGEAQCNHRRWQSPAALTSAVFTRPPPSSPGPPRVLP